MVHFSAKPKNEPHSLFLRANRAIGFNLNNYWKSIKKHENNYLSRIKTYLCAAFGTVLTQIETKAAQKTSARCAS
ncbi:MAG: hypothetical protein U5L45_26215 [Saprospiraceae bacterium]|nr:hypothetical protein [Saprospiraceae bacterium]